MRWLTPQDWRGLGVGLAGVAFLGFCMVGCQSGGGSAPYRPNHRGLDGPDAGIGSSAQSVEQARRSIEAGDTTTVIPRLLHVISNAPESKAAMDARYWLAVAYGKISSYRDAIDMYGEYLKLAPEGKYANEARRAVESLNKEYREKYQTPEEMDAEVQDLVAQVEKEPANHDLQMRLANTLWKRGDYESAARIYYQVLREHPEHALDAEVRDRFEKLPNGEYIVLTPSEIQRRETERQPLLVFNTASFKSGKDLLTREALYYAVTGQVVNRGKSVLYGVQVVVTIYGFGNMVYDTNTIHIGRMNPGEIRAFSARFSNFDNIDEVVRFECVASDR